jgi:hypothetical protein
MDDRFEEGVDTFELVGGKTKVGAILFGLGLTLPWLLAAPALFVRFGL